MVKYDSNAYTRSPMRISIAIIVFIPQHINYWILLKIFSVNNAKQMNYIHIIASLLTYIELFIISSIFIDKVFAFSIHKIIGLAIIEAICLLDVFYTFPYWIDDDIADIYERPSDLYPDKKENLDPLAFSVDKEIANIQQDKAADEIAQQSSKNTGGKNTEITVNVANGLDLKNNTIVLPSQPKQAKTDDEE